MKWRDINHTHHGLAVEVTDKALRLHPTAQKVYTTMGNIKCKEGNTPILLVHGGKILILPGWIDVEIIE